MTRLIVLLGLLISYLSPMTATAAAMIVLESNTQRFAVGDVLDSDAIIELDDGDELLLATETGAFRIEGPIPRTGENEKPVIEPLGAYAGMSAGKTSASDVLSALVAADEEDDTTVGAVRGGGSTTSLGCPRNPPSAWSLRVARGEQCIAAGEAVSLWREDASSNTSLHVQRVTTEEEAIVNWPSDANNVIWPESVPIADGEIYSVRYAGDSSAQSLILRKMPNSMKSDMQAIAWLSTHGCKCQALALYNNRQE